MLDTVSAILPLTLKQLMQKLPREIQVGLEEIRIRKHRPLEIRSRQEVAFVNPLGQIEPNCALAYHPSAEECKCVLELATHHSLYSYEEELKQGYITIAGGHRIGLAGRTLLTAGQVKMIRDVGSFNIRIARELKGISTSLIPLLVDWQLLAPRIHPTLVMSLPGQGKTTLLRDLTRYISSGDSADSSLRRHRPSFKIGVIDERSEIAACVKGIPSFDLGPRTDVMDACPKAEGMMMMIRSMSPEVLVVDEIGCLADVKAVQEARYAGITVIASAHAANLEEARRSPVLEELFRTRVFERFILVERTTNHLSPYRVLDSHGKSLAYREDAPAKS